MSSNDEANDVAETEPITPENSGSTAQSTTNTSSQEMSESTTETTTEESNGDIRRYVRYVLLTGFTLLALVALLRFYFAVSATIDTWISQEYRSLFHAAFNLVVLLAAGIGISWQVRALR